MTNSTSTFTNYRYWECCRL